MAWVCSRSKRLEYAAKRAERLRAARELGTHTKQQWAALKAALGKCVRCGCTDSPLVKDHIHPIYAGGSDGLENLQPLCVRCNGSKGPERIDFRPANWRELMRAA